MTLTIAMISFTITLAVGTVLHELAHAAGALLGGLRLKSISLGAGPLLWRISIGGVPIEIRPMLAFGMVRTYPSLKWRRWRAILGVAAGPACDILVFIATLAIADRVPSSHTTNVAISASLVAQFLSLIGTLLPRRAMLDQRVVASDGLQLLRLLLGREDGTIFRQNYELLLRRSLPPGQPLPAFTDRSEEIGWLVLSRNGNTQEIAPEKVAALEKLLAADLPACEEIAVLDALVTSTLAATDPAWIAKLDRWSERVYALAPDIPTLAGSRGSALIEIGRSEEGLAVLSKAEDGKAFNDCLVHAFRALGHFKMGQAEAAKAEFARTKSLFKYEEWQGVEIERIVERISRTIGEELDWPSAWSRVAANAALRTETSARPAPRGTR